MFSYKETVKLLFTDILKEYEVYYSEYQDLLTKQQWNLLIAIAKDEGVSQVTASSFIRNHDLSNSATVKRGFNALLNKKMIFKKGTKHLVYDVFLAKWLRRL